MAESGPARRGIGGLGAIIFVGTLGAIAFYVQQQSVPDARDVVRKSATVVADEAEANDAPAPLPWHDRLDLAAATLVPYAATPAPTPGSESGGTATAAAPPATEDPAPDPANGRLVQDLSDGHRILLTLDPVLQDSILQIFRNREVPYAGAVMIDLRDNAVLAFAGYSAMDPEVDPLEILTTPWAPAASTFKLVTAVALLLGKDATPATRVCFSGGLHGIEDEQLRDVKGRDNQCASLSDALAHSYNLVIGKLALRHVSQESLVAASRKLRFDAEIPFEFPVEPSPIHIPKDPIERAKVAAGFWNVDLSPVHAAVLASIVARKGVFQPPHMIAQVRGPTGTDLTPAISQATRVLDRDVAAQVGEMMVGTTEVGTARTSFRDQHGHPYLPDVTVAGKTGSLTGKQPPALNYNWFIGFAPADEPEVAFAVVLANTPKWRIKAHYAGRRLVQLYQQRREDIARAREARLTDIGLALPQRDPSGALVAERKEASKPEKSAALPPPPIPVRKDEPVEAAAEEAATEPLPPVPGPLPKPPG